MLIEKKRYFGVIIHRKETVFMSTEENKATFRRFFEEMWNRGNLAVIDELVSSNHVFHEPNSPEPIRGPEGFKQYVKMNRHAYPDVHVTIEDLIAEGDKVTNRFTFTGTQTGDLLGIPPTGKRVTVTAIVISHFVAGKFMESWINSDGLGMLQQLGVIPTLGQAS
jgi:steroid delta-isomerase-like uncharacterized protein